MESHRPFDSPQQPWGWPIWDGRITPKGPWNPTTPFPKKKKNYLKNYLLFLIRYIYKIYKNLETCHM